MISRQLLTYQWNRPVFNRDSYGQDIPTPTSLGTIEVSVYFDTQVFKNNPQWAEATHIGLTKEKSVQINDTIDGYLVLQTNPIGRWNQLILKEV